MRISWVINLEIKMYGKSCKSSEFSKREIYFIDTPFDKLNSKDRPLNICIKIKKVEGLFPKKFDIKAKKISNKRAIELQRRNI